MISRFVDLEVAYLRHSGRGVVMIGSKHQTGRQPIYRKRGVGRAYAIFDFPIPVTQVLTQEL